MEQLPRRVAKLTAIIASYGAAFLALVHLGLLLLRVPTFQPPILHTDLLSWLIEKNRHSVWWDGATAALLRDAGLLLLFGLVHSGLSSRGESRSAVGTKRGPVDRVVYVGVSGLALGALVVWWESVPVVLWSAAWLEGTLVGVVHGGAWMLLYGTNLMLDLPDMVGFSQVVVSSPNVVHKSPQLQRMLKTQRHMGLLPFAIILLVHPLMTLDRAVMTVMTLVWAWRCWRSDEDYGYAVQMRGKRLEH